MFDDIVHETEQLPSNLRELAQGERDLATLDDKPTWDQMGTILTMRKLQRARQKMKLPN